MVCSNSSTIGAGPHFLTFHLVCLRPELWPTLCVAVWPRATCTGALSTLWKEERF